jgi:hypothetical protein
MKVWGAVSNCTAAFSTIGNPTLQIPCGFTKAGLPVGLQIAGRWGEEALILGAGAAFEKSKPLWSKRPPLEDKAQGQDKFSPVSSAPGGDSGPAEISADDIEKIASRLGHRVDPDRLDGLAAGVSLLMRQLDELDNLDISGCERAETMNLLELKAEDILGT